MLQFLKMLDINYAKKTHTHELVDRTPKFSKYFMLG